MSKFIKFIVLIFVIGFMYITYTQRGNDTTTNNDLNDYSHNLIVEETQDNTIKFVKNGVLDYDKSLTVGEAFDNWKACHKNASWTSFKTDNKRKIVQFTCDAKVDHLDKHIIFQFTINKDKTFILNYIGEEYIDTDGILSTSSSSKPFNTILKDIYENRTRFELTN